MKKPRKGKSEHLNNAVMALTNLEILVAIGIDKTAATKLLNIGCLKNSYHPSYLNRLIKAHVKDYEKKNGPVSGRTVNLLADSPDYLATNRLEILLQNDDTRKL